MARPKKWRKVCCLPQQNQFGPLGRQAQQKEYINMSVEEYETIRLIDLEGMTQEECADKMDVARTTVQSIYAEARKKIAHALVDGNVLHIEGGDYQLCDGSSRRCGRSGCHRHQHFAGGRKEETHDSGNPGRE